MKRNAELFKKVADEIRKDPACYDQGTWGRPDPTTLCGTRMCIAGHTARLTGWKPVRPDTWSTVSKGGRDAEYVEDVARDALGLNVRESDYLFESDFMQDASYEEVAEALEQIGRGEADVEDFYNGY